MQPSYGPESIVVLEGLEAVRRRPGMYVGDVHDGSGLEHMLWEIVGNTLDQHLARHARHLRVDVDAQGWVTVEDDGAGIPIAPVPTSQRSALEHVFLFLHAGATWDGHFPHVHVTPRLHGVGLAAVNALCMRLEVESRHRGVLWRAAFERGQLVEPAHSQGPASRSGTRIRYLPDPTIFSRTQMDLGRVERRLRDLAWLSPLLEVRWQGETLPGRGGLAGWVRELAGDVPIAADRVVATTRTIDDAFVDLALAWTDDASEPIELSFVSHAETRDGGTHLVGLRRALLTIARELGCDAEPSVVRELVEPGLVAVVHVGLYDPQFGAPTRDKLVTPLAATVTQRALEDALSHFARPHTALRAFLRARLGVE